MSQSVLKLYQRFSRLPGGRALFSRALCLKAPFFASISPLMSELRPGYAEVRIRNRRKVHNHIGTIHAIAMCNMAELAGGTMTDVTIPRSMRWIPKGMTVEYLKIADTAGLRAEARPTVEVKEGEKQDYPVQVDVLNDRDETVFRATINMYLSPR